MNNTFCRNAFTIDIEDWFCSTPHGENFSNWNKHQLRIEQSTNKLLDILKLKKIKATFFVLGWIAEKIPELVNTISKEGHEVASHGYSHTQISKQTPEEFKYDILKAKEITEAIICKSISGYRAPCFSITMKTLWALDILYELGFKYDSSIFPFSLHPEYGISEFSLNIKKLENGLIEAPLSCIDIKGFRIPVGGGGYFRLYPYKLIKNLITLCNNNNRNFIFYLHPWEIDTEQPRLGINPIYRWRHYHNLNNTYNKLENLMNDFEFTTLSDIIYNKAQDHEYLYQKKQGAKS